MDQAQSKTLLQFASPFDMKVGLQKSLSLIRKLHRIYGLKFEHEVSQNWDKKIVMHEQKIDCTEKSSQIYGQYLLHFGQSIEMNQKQVTEGFWTKFC